MSDLDRTLRRILLVMAIAAVAATGLEARRATTIGNGRISIVFGDRGITALTDISIGRVYKLKDDGFRIVVDGTTLDSATLPKPRQSAQQGRVVYAYASGGYELTVTYEIEPAWRFVSKQLAIVKAPAPVYRVNEVHVFRDELLEPVADRFVPGSARENLGAGDYGVFLRFADRRGLLVAVQNPFLRVEGGDATFSVRYAPDMEWRSQDGPFVTDRGLLAPYRQTDEHRIVITGPDIPLAPNDALSLGLAIHELATNAAKYGALTRAGGEVSVLWEFAGERRVRLEWKERGGPPVKATRGRGFGTDLIEKIVANELDSPVQLDFDQEGVTCVLTIPVRQPTAFAMRAPRRSEPP